MRIDPLFEQLPHPSLATNEAKHPPGAFWNRWRHSSAFLLASSSVLGSCKVSKHAKAWLTSVAIAPSTSIANRRRREGKPMPSTGPMG
eukprot:jgi/Pico_ML_1/55871/g1492.t1